MRNGPDYLNIIHLLLEKDATTRFKRNLELKETDLHWWAETQYPDMTGYRTLNLVGTWCSFVIIHVVMISKRWQPTRQQLLRGVTSLATLCIYRP
jgi:hypothetical protein